MQGLRTLEGATAPMPMEPLFFAPFVSSPMRVDAAWLDYNGHLNVAYFGVLFDRAVDEAFLLCGLGPDYVSERRASYFVVETRSRFRREIGGRDRVRITLQLLEVDDKRLRYAMEMRDERDGALAATCEQLAVHVDMETRKAAPFPADIRAALEAMRSAHGALPAPEWVGGVISLRGPAPRH
jgi:acyl-CoA thioester hydrolase